MFTFSNDRVRLRAYEPDDLERFLRWGNDPEVAAFNLGMRLYSLEGMAQKMERVTKDGYYFCMDALDQGDAPQHIGSISLHEPHWRSGSSELSISIGEKDCWSRGYGTEAIRLLLEYGFGELNLHRIELFVFSTNPRAFRSYEKVGFRYEGYLRGDVRRDGRYNDGYMMGILRDEWEQIRDVGSAPGDVARFVAPEPPAIPAGGFRQRFSQNQPFRNNLVRLRKHTHGDATNYVLWFADTEVTRGISNYGPVSHTQQRAWVEEMATTSDPIFAVDAVGGEQPQHIGNVSLFSIDQRSRQAELGIAIGDKAYWGKGYGPAAMSLLLDYGFGELNLHRIYLQVLDDNQRAIRSYERLGFTHEGARREAFYRQGAYHDDVQMSMLAHEWMGFSEQ